MNICLTAMARQCAAILRNSNETDSSIAMAAFAAQPDARRLHSLAFINMRPGK